MFFKFCIALLTLLMMTAESMFSKRPVLRITAALIFLLQFFSTHVLFSICFSRKIKVSLVMYVCNVW